MSWYSQNDITKRHRDYVSAPKMPLPGHEESYNPPPEYLFTEEEVGYTAWPNRFSYIKHRLLLVIFMDALLVYTLAMVLHSNVFFICLSEIGVAEQGGA